mgnify:CR=1 FL=1
MVTQCQANYCNFPLELVIIHCRGPIHDGLDQFLIIKPVFSLYFLILLRMHRFSSIFRSNSLLNQERCVSGSRDHDYYEISIEI